MLTTRLAVGRVGLEVRQVVRDEGADIFNMKGAADVVCVLLFAVRFAWFGMMSGPGRTRMESLRPNSAK